MEPQGTQRTYVLHFVKLTGLQPRTTYHYQVASGSAAGQWSAVFSFRSAYRDGATRLGMYGDMGHSHYNCMSNLLEDCRSGAIDFIAHSTYITLSPHLSHRHTLHHRR